MRVIEDLYTYDINEKKAKRLLKKISRGKPAKGLYVVVYPLFNDGVLEIYSYNQLLQPYYKRRSDDIEIVGISMSKAEADMLVLGIFQRMCVEGYTDFGNLRGFFE